MSDKMYTPLLPPTVPENYKQKELKPEELELQKKLFEHFSKFDYSIPGIEKGELAEEEKFWLSYECMLRYLRATKWTLEKSIQRLEDTLKWRREFGLYDLLIPAHVEPEAVTGKEIVFGYDTERRPALYMIPSRQNTTDPTRQVQFAVWMLERSIDLMGPGVETIDLLINYADKAKNPSLSTARTVLNILQDHYPERLGLALILNVPFLLNAFYKLITPFIDPVTRLKMKFNPQVISDNIFEADMVMKEWWGGDCDFTYEHDKYWPALVAMCEERKKEWMGNWRKLGGTVGLKEWDYKSGLDQEKINEEMDETEKTVDIQVGEDGYGLDV